MRVSPKTASNSTFLFDKTTNFSPKLEEFREIVHELAVEESAKWSSSASTSE